MWPGYGQAARVASLAGLLIEDGSLLPVGESGTPGYLFRKLICMIKNCLLPLSTPPSTHSRHNSTLHGVSSHLCSVEGVFFRPTSQVRKTEAERGKVACPSSYHGEMAKAITVALSASTLPPHSVLCTQLEGSS